MTNLMSTPPKHFTNLKMTPLKNKFKLFKPPSNQVFLEDQEFIFYKSYQTLLDIKNS